jgi:hypothetical protein
MSQIQQPFVLKVDEEDAIEKALDGIPIAIHSQQWKRAIEALNTISTKLKLSQKEETSVGNSLVNLTDQICYFLTMNVITEAMADQEKEAAHLCFNENDEEGINHMDRTIHHLDNIESVKVNDIFPCLREFLLIWYSVRSPQPLTYNFIRSIKDGTKKTNAAKTDIKKP